jgi:dipeptidase D
MSDSQRTGDLASLEPAEVWKFFSGIAAVPRPSKHEGKIREHLGELAQRLGLASREDAAGNQVIEVPASPGCEDAPITVLQGHMDMVCEKNNGTRHDFEQDPIRTILDRDASGEQIVRADGTTLGADNGIGLAMALAAACSAEVVHGPLELLFTVDEEAGMTGAKALRPKSFRGRRLLNLDSEEDDALYIGCAGGCDASLSWEFASSPPPPGAEICRISVSGLRGGHSGCDIHENRGNAIKLLAKVLSTAGCDATQIASISGGSKRNVIPREASADLLGPAGLTKALHAAAEAVASEAQMEAGEPQIAIHVEPLPAAEKPALSCEDTGVVLAALIALPHGVLALEPEIPGLVKTSNNLATIATQWTKNDSVACVRIGALARSSAEAEIGRAVAQIEAVGRLAGAACASGNAYPGWQPDVNSRLLDVCRRVYCDLFGEAPKVTAIHAGLECGIIGRRVGHIDMVSFGPRVEGAHSPDERVYVASVQKSWRMLVAVLGELARG